MNCLILYFVNETEDFIQVIFLLKVLIEAILRGFIII